MAVSLPLNALETTGLIRLAQIEPELEYLFRHALVQEAAYVSILKIDRKKLHLAVANEMEKIYPERLDELAALLASHYREAGESQKALGYYKRAAGYAAQKFANDEAVYNLRAALELCATELERSEIQLQLGIVIQLLGRLDEAENFLRESLPAFRANHRLETIAEIYCNLSQIAWGKNDVANSLVISREGLKEVGDLPPSEPYAELLRYIANGCVFNDLLDEAEIYIVKALPVAEQSGSKSALAQVLITKALIEDRRGKSEQAIITLEQAIDIAEKANHPFSISRAKNNLVYVFLRLGRNIEGAKQIESMVAYTRQVNSIFGELWFLAELINIYCDLGRINEVTEIVPKMMELLKSSGGKTYRAQVVGAKLQALIYTGKPRETIEELIAERDEALGRNDKQMYMNYSYTLALGYMMMKDYARAAQEVERGINEAGIWAGVNYQYLLAGLQAVSGAELSIAKEVFQRGEAVAKPAETFIDSTARQYALMHIHAREEKFEEALTVSAELAKKYKTVHFPWLSALVLWEAGEIALKANDKNKAKEFLKQAMKEYQEMNIPVYAAQVEKQLGGL